MPRGAETSEREFRRLTENMRNANRQIQIGTRERQREIRLRRFGARAGGLRGLRGAAVGALSSAPADFLIRNSMAGLSNPHIGAANSLSEAVARGFADVGLASQAQINANASVSEQIKGILAPVARSGRNVSAEEAQRLRDVLTPRERAVQDLFQKIEGQESAANRAEGGKTIERALTGLDKTMLDLTSVMNDVAEAIKSFTGFGGR